MDVLLPDGRHRDVRFWEGVSSRKSKSRRRAARKYLSSSQERFSIADDTFIADRDSPYKDGGVARGGSTPAGEVSVGGGISDYDLIMELSRAEAETDTRSTPPPATTAVSPYEGSSRPDSDTTISMTPARPTELAFLDEDDFRTPSGAVHTELLALEDLERELGLEGFMSPKAPQGGGGSSAQKIAELQSAVEDDIDELEKYLQSLQPADTPIK